MGAERLTDDDLAEIRARHGAATRGPYAWFGNTRVHSVYLATTHSGRVYVMDFDRWGMGNAAPRFQVPVGTTNGGRGCGRMTHAKELVRRPAPHSNDVAGVDHPDAVALAKSWEDREALLAEVAALRAESASLAARLAETGERVAGLIAENSRLVDEGERLRAFARGIADGYHSDYCAEYLRDEECDCRKGEAAKALAGDGAGGGGDG